MARKKEQVQASSIEELEEMRLEAEANENANQRDLGSDEFDDRPDSDGEDDRVRGAGRQSLEELAIEGGLGWGLEEGRGGLRSDRPDKTVNDPDPAEREREAS